MAVQKQPRKSREFDDGECVHRNSKKQRKNQQYESRRDRAERMRDFGG